MRVNLKERVPIKGDTHLKPPRWRWYSSLFEPINPFFGLLAGFLMSHVFLGIYALTQKPTVKRTFVYPLQISSQFVMAVRTCLAELGHLNWWKFILLLVLLTNRIAVAQAEQCLSKDKLIAHWLFDGNANDASNNGHDGTIVGEPELTTDKFGTANSAYQFFYKKKNGKTAGGFIEVAHHSELNLTNTHFSLSAWILQDVTNEGHSGIILAKRETENGFFIGIEGQEGEQEGFVKYKPFKGEVMRSTESIKQGWNHIVFTYDGSKGKIYINGQFKGEKALNSPTETQKNLFIGKESANLDEKHRWLGKLDNIRIYKCALSSSELEDLYKYPNNLPPQPPINLAPQHELTNVDPNGDVTLTWKITPDPDGDKLTTLIYVDGKLFNRCKKNSQPNSCIIPSDELDYGEKILWHIVVSDGYNTPVPGEMSIFTTQENNPPNEPDNPSLKNGDSTIEAPFGNVNQNLPTTLSWKGGDPDVGDKVTYTVEIVGCSATSSCEKEPQATSCTIPAGTLKSDEICTWLVKAEDNYDHTSTGKPWQFTTQPNKPPNEASHPVLKQEDKIINPTVDLIDPKQDLTFGWQLNGDPENDVLTSKICYASTKEIAPDKINEEVIACISDYGTETSATLQASLKKLDYDTPYAWIVSIKGEPPGNKSEWDIFTFKTTPAPATIDLTVNSGYANSLLDWDTFNAELFKITNYRVLRIKGNNPAAFKDANQYTLVKGSDELLCDNTDNSSCEDDEPLEVGEQYCYQVDGLDENGHVVTNSSFNPEETCIIFGETILQVKGASGLKGGDSQSVPLIMPNGGGLKIASGTICLGFDANVIEYDGVDSTAFTDSGYSFLPQVKPIFGISGITHFVQIIIGYNSIDPAEEEFLPTINELMGAGSLAEVYFRVKQDTTADYSPLKLLHNKNAEFNGISAVDCSNLYVPNNEDAIPLTMRNGKFTVKTKKGLRNGNGDILPRFWVRNAYIRGDLNGNGIVDAADVRIADGMGITKGKVKGYEWTPERLMAGDVNRDGVVNSADGDLILEYGFTGKWNSDETPATSTKRKPRTRRMLRDGNQNNPMLSIDNISGTAGSDIVATLSVCNVDNLSSFNTTIAYDKNVVEKIYRIRTTGLATGASMPYYDNKTGILRIGMHTRTPIEGCGAIATMTVRLVSGGNVKSSPLAIAKTNLYDKYGRDFATSVLQRNIDRENGTVTITDVEEPPIVDDVVMTPIKDIMPTPNVADVYSASVKVIDHNGNFVSGVTVVVGEKSTNTDSNGYAAVLGLLTGEHLMTITKGDDISATQTCVVGNNENCHLDFVVDSGESEMSGQYACYGIAADSNGKPITGATMQLENNIITTDEYGYFAFVDLVAGEHSIKASKEGNYVFMETACQVGDGENRQINFVNRNVALVNPAICNIYATNDGQRNNSQFITISLDGQYTLNDLGAMYPGYDIEAIAIDPKTNLIYAVSGEDATEVEKGYLFLLDGTTGELAPLGSTGFNEIEELVFSSDGILWAWAKDDGLVTIDLIAGFGTLVFPSDWQIEGLTILQNQQSHQVFYGTAGKELWTYNSYTGILPTAPICSNLPGEIEALGNWEGLLIFSVHNDKTFSLRIYNPQTCQIEDNLDIPTGKYNDIEGIGWPIEACTR
jgi:hypothetical protein